MCMYINEYNDNKNRLMGKSVANMNNFEFLKIELLKLRYVTM